MTHTRYYFLEAAEEALARHIGIFEGLNYIAHDFAEEFQAICRLFYDSIPVNRSNKFRYFSD